MSTINADLAIELLIKKYLGAVNTSPNTVYSSDNSIFARPNIVPSLQILNQAIPTVAPVAAVPPLDPEAPPSKNPNVPSYLQKSHVTGPDGT